MFHTTDEIRAANRALGHHWFDPATLRFFRSRVGARVYGGCLFVSSEQCPPSPRAYSLRCAEPDGRITTLGPFQYYTSRRAAIRDAEQLALWHARPYRDGDGGFRLQLSERTGLPADAVPRDWYLRCTDGQWHAVALWGWLPEPRTSSSALTPVRAIRAALRALRAEHLDLD